MTDHEQIFILEFIGMMQVLAGKLNDILDDTHDPQVAVYFTERLSMYLWRISRHKAVMKVCPSGIFGKYARLVWQAARIRHLMLTYGDDMVNNLTGEHREKWLRALRDTFEFTEKNCTWTEAFINRWSRYHDALSGPELTFRNWYTPDVKYLW